MQIVIKNSADKYLSKLENIELSAYFKIRTFLRELSQIKNPFTLPNAKN